MCCVRSHLCWPQLSQTNPEGLNKKQHNHTMQIVLVELSDGLELELTRLGRGNGRDQSIIPFKPFTHNSLQDHSTNIYYGFVCKQNCLKLIGCLIEFL